LIDGVYSPQEAREELQVAQSAAKYEAMSEKQVSKEIKRLEKLMLDMRKIWNSRRRAGTRPIACAERTVVRRAGGG